MMHALALILSLASAPITIDGKATDVVASGAVTTTANGFVVNGGMVQMGLDQNRVLTEETKSRPSTLRVTLVDRGGDSNVIRFAGYAIRREAKGLVLVAGSGRLSLGASSGRMKLSFAAAPGKLTAYRDGKALGSLPYQLASGGQSFLIGAAKGDKKPWKGEVEGLEILLASKPKPAQPETASHEVDGKTATVEAELVASTDTPDPQSVLPYRNALITQDYKITSIKAGGIKGVKVGATIRIARWGIIASKKTAVSELKRGAKVTIELGRFDEYPSLQHYYTIDTLEESSAPYLLDTATKI